MFDKMELELPGVTKPFIVTPENPRWNKATLASLSYGYASSFNLLQLTTFYNGIIGFFVLLLFGICIG